MPLLQSLATPKFGRYKKLMTPIPKTASAWQEALHRNVFRGPQAGRWGSLKFRLLESLYRRVARGDDPLIQRTVAGVPLWMPFSHHLIFHLKHFPNYASNLGRLAQIVAKDQPGFSLIDIGANIGDSAAFVRREGPWPVLCVEGDELFFSLLEKNTRGMPDVERARAFVGEPDDQKSWESNRERGTAALTSSKDGKGIKLQPLDALLKNHPRFSRARFLKIDTDGFDGQVLRGAKSLLMREHPVLFFEYDVDCLERNGDSAEAVRNFLKDLDYSGVLLYDNFGELYGSAHLSDEKRWEEIDAYLRGRRSQVYADIAVFHEAEEALFLDARRQEVDYRNAFARGQKP